jgi:NAD(P)H dehydrogenase (quinone)
MNDVSTIERPLKHAVILCHPEEHSFNGAIADAYCNMVQRLGHEIVLRDLYRMDFDPILRGWERATDAQFARSPDVERELTLLSGCDVFTLVYPIWFGTPPAMMKGYVERVLGSGVSPRSVAARAQTSLLGGKRLLSFTTSAMSEPWLNEQGQWESLRYIFDHYLAHAFGMRGDEHVHFSNVTTGMEPRTAGAAYKRYRVGRPQKGRRRCGTALRSNGRLTGKRVCALSRKLLCQSGPPRPSSA